MPWALFYRAADPIFRGTHALSSIYLAFCEMPMTLQNWPSWEPDSCQHEELQFFRSCVCCFGQKLLFWTRTFFGDTIPSTTQKASVCRIVIPTSQGPSWHSFCDIINKSVLFLFFLLPFSLRLFSFFIKLQLILATHKHRWKEHAFIFVLCHFMQVRHFTGASPLMAFKIDFMFRP